MFRADLTFEWYEDVMVVHVHFYFFVQNQKDTWMRAISATVMVIFSKVPF